MAKRQTLYRLNTADISSTHKTMASLKKAWAEASGKERKAFTDVGGSWVDISHKMKTEKGESFTDREREFTTAAARDSAIIENAAYFTIVRFRGVGVYERHERKTAVEALALAKQLSEQEQGNYIIYAVGPTGLSAFVETVIYKKGA